MFVLLLDLFNIPHDIISNEISIIRSLQDENNCWNVSICFRCLWRCTIYRLTGWQEILKRWAFLNIILYLIKIVYPGGSLFLTCIITWNSFSLQIKLRQPLINLPFQVYRWDVVLFICVMLDYSSYTTNLFKCKFEKKVVMTIFPLINEIDFQAIISTSYISCL